MAALDQMNSVLGVLDLETEAAQSGDESQIEALIQARNDARANKDWSRADELRDELLELGIVIKDAAGVTTWQRVVQ